MRIGICAISLSGLPTGIANVIINFINSLGEEHAIILISNRISEEAKKRITHKNTKFRISGHEKLRNWLMSGSMAKMLNAGDYDFLWFPTPQLWVKIKKSTPTLITVNDFVSKDFRGTMDVFTRISTMLFERRSIKRADKIWCISEYTRDKLREYYPKLKCKKIYVGCAADPFIHKIDNDCEMIEKLYKKIGITDKYIMFVGSLEPRKNLSFLLKVYKRLRYRNKVQLVIVGGTGWGNTGIAKIIGECDYPKKDVLFPGYFSTGELRMLYNNAECYVSTSLNEGFGLPQLEAMNCGCPVVTAHNSAMIEVVNGAGVTVKGWNIIKWCNAIEFAINNRKNIVVRQDERRQKYTWHKVTEGLIRYMQEEI